MAGFRFQLEPVLKHRRVVEDERQRGLARLLRERFILERQLRRLQTGVSTDKGEMAGALVGRVDVDRIRQHATHWNQAALRTQQIAIQIVGLDRQIDTARRRLLEATKARKALELLRDRRLRQWRREQDRREAAALDELATQAYGRHRKEMSP